MWTGENDSAFLPLFENGKKISIFKIFRIRVTGPKFKRWKYDSITYRAYALSSSVMHDIIVFEWNLHCPSTLKWQADVCKRKTPLGGPLSKTCVSWMGLYSVEAGAIQLLNGSGEHTHHTALQGLLFLDVHCTTTMATCNFQMRRLINDVERQFG